MKVVNLLIILSLIFPATLFANSEETNDLSALGEAAHTNSFALKTIELEDSIKNFEERCLDENGNVDEAKLNTDSLNSCDVDGQFVIDEILLFENEIAQNLETIKASACQRPEEISELEELSNAATLAASHVECRKDQIELQKESCGKAFMCNVGRSAVRLATSGVLMPKVVKNKIRSMAYEKMNSISKDCAKEDDSDCIKEFVNNMLASLMSTATALWDLAKQGVKSLFSFTGWFDKKSDKAHQAMNETKENVVNFLEHPFDWIGNKMTQIQNAIDGWIKSTVLCQKWEGEPHLSKCEVPLYSYDCIDCETRVNAFCAAAGAIVSEVGIAVLTAGTGTVISLGARAGGVALRMAAKKAAKKIGIKKPKIPMSIGAKGNIVANAAQKAFQAGANTLAYLKDKYASMKAAIDKVKQIKAVKVANAVVTKTVETIADPTTLLAKVTDKAYVKTATMLSNSSSRTLSTLARMDVRQAKKAKTDRAAKEAFRDKARTPSNVRVVVAGKKLSSKANAVSGASTNKPTITSQNQKPTDHGLGKRPDESHGGHNGDRGYTTSGNERNRNTPERPEIGTEKGKGDRHRKEDHQSGEHEKSSAPLAAGVQMGSIAAVKGAQIAAVTGREETPTREDEHQNPLDDFEQKREEVAEKQRKREKEKERKKARSEAVLAAQKPIETSSELKRTLGITDNVDLNDKNQREAVERKISSLQDVYSESNRSNVINDMMAKDSTLSREAASQKFSQRQQELQSANEYLKRSSSTDNIASSKSAKQIAEKLIQKKEKDGSNSQYDENEANQNEQRVTATNKPKKAKEKKDAINGGLTSSPSPDGLVSVPITSNSGSSNSGMAVTPNFAPVTPNVVPDEVLKQESYNNALLAAQPTSTKTPESSDEVNREIASDQNSPIETDEPGLYDSFTNLFNEPPKPDLTLGERTIKSIPKTIAAENDELLELFENERKINSIISETEVYKLENVEIHKVKIGGSFFYLSKKASGYELITEKSALELLN